jgi:hypothetical protein
MSQVLLEKGLPLRVRKKGRTKGPNWLSMVRGVIVQAR